MNDAAWPIALVLGFWGLCMLLALGGMALTIWAVIDCVRRRFPDDSTKIVWIIVIVVLQLVGAIVYYFVGRPMGCMPGPGERIDGR